MTLIPSDVIIYIVDANLIKFALAYAYTPYFHITSNFLNKVTKLTIQVRASRDIVSKPTEILYHEFSNVCGICAALMRIGVIVLEIKRLSSTPGRRGV